MDRTVPHTTLPGVDPARALAARERVWIDLRAPSEFADDHAPGARNVPLFDDDERALVGTLYRRASPDAAFAEARAITGAKVGELVARIADAADWDPPRDDLAARVERFCADGIAGLEGALNVESLAALPSRPVLLSCWRGGLRSRAVTALVRELGLERAFVVEGGYRAYRRHVRALLDGWSAPPAVVLRGLTGVGKTLVLRALEEQRPGTTLDLEAAAGHRSSILGMVGLDPVTQKAFESNLAATIAAGFDGVCVFEGESRKVGDAICPPRVWEALDGGTNVLLTADVERRVDVLVEDYLAHDENRAQLERQLPFIEERLGARKYGGTLVALLREGRERELVALLLERYYDPLYRHSESGREYARTIDARDPSHAAAQVATFAATLATRA